jgi:hypothetical protein
MIDQPNISLQRTAPCGLAAELGSLGRLRRLLPLIAIVMSWARCATAPPPARLDADAFVALSGEWGGTFEARQAGDCTLNGKNKSSLPVQMQIQVSNRGAIEIVEHKNESRSNGDARISGTISPDGRVAARRIFQAKCSGSPHEVETLLAGAVTDSPHGRQLEMSGVQAPCPDNGCKFKVTYRVVKTR